MYSGKKATFILIIIILAFSLCLICFPRNTFAGEIHGKAEIGYDYFNEIGYTELQIEYCFFFLIDHKIYGATKVLFEPHIIYNYPFKDIYTLGYQADLGKHIYIKYEANCSHPVMISSESKLEKVLLYKNTFCTVRTISVGVKF